MTSKHVSGTQIVPRVSGPSMSFRDEANNQGILTDVNQVMGYMNRRYSCAYFTNKVSDFLWKDAHMLSCLVILKEAQRLPRLFLVFAIQQPPHTCPSLHPFLSCVSIIGPAHSRACEQAWLSTVLNRNSSMVPQHPCFC